MIVLLDSLIISKTVILGIKVNGGRMFACPRVGLFSLF